jgi:hypothetical protein
VSEVAPRRWEYQRRAGTALDELADPVLADAEDRRAPAVFTQYDVSSPVGSLPTLRGQPLDLVTVEAAAMAAVEVELAAVDECPDVADRAASTCAASHWVGPSGCGRAMVRP